MKTIIFRQRRAVRVEITGCQWCAMYENAICAGCSARADRVERFYLLRTGIRMSAEAIRADCRKDGMDPPWRSCVAGAVRDVRYVLRFGTTDLAVMLDEVTAPERRRRAMLLEGAMDLFRAEIGFNAIGTTVNLYGRGDRDWGLNELHEAVEHAADVTGGTPFCKAAYVQLVGLHDTAELIATLKARLGLIAYGYVTLRPPQAPQHH